MKFHIIALIATCALPLSAQTQVTPEPGRAIEGNSPFRTEFLSWDVRADAEKRNTESNPYYLELEPFAGRDEPGGNMVLVADIEVPYMWLDRALFLRSDGIGPFSVEVNGTQVGHNAMARTPVEFEITDHVTDGVNRIILTLDHEASPLEERFPGRRPYRLYLCSQPKVRIEDFRITALPDSTDSYGVLSLAIALSNSYNSPETITVGYDIYAPGGKLQYYDMKEISVPANGRDTVVFNEFIYGTQQNLWSADNPSLYYGMLTVRREKRMTEYIPYRTGFGRTEVIEGQLHRNGRKEFIKTGVFISSGSPQEDLVNLEALKKDGVNALRIPYPQPMWFYELCDEKGFYIVDQADNNNSGGAPSHEPTLVNDPEWLGAFNDRCLAMSQRTKNNVSVVGWSLGTASGNGFNHYRNYLLLKDTDPGRPVIYDGRDGQWNGDDLNINYWQFQNEL